MRISSLTVGPFQENSYLVVDEATGDAVMIDPGDQPDDLIAMIESSGATIRAIWLTHAHLDHIGAVSALRRRYGDIPVHLHALDRAVYSAQSLFAEQYGVPFEQPDDPDAEFAHGDIARVGSLAFDVIHAPGHSPGHVMFLGHGALIGGDVLFAGSIGRTDLPLADPSHMQKTLDHLATLPPDTLVYPGHGGPTTIGEELASNPFLNGIANVKRYAN